MAASRRNFQLSGLLFTNRLRVGIYRLSVGFIPKETPRC